MKNYRDLIGGQLFAFSGIDGETDWENGLVGRLMGNCLELRLPYDGGVLLFPDSPDGVYSDCLTAGATRVAFANAHNLLIQGQVLPLGISNAYTIQQQGNLTLLAVAGTINRDWLNADFDGIFNARKKWLDSFRLDHKPILRRAAAQIKTQINTPQGNIKHYWTTPDRWPHRNMWLWDSVFHCIGLRHLDLTIAKDSLRAMFDVQDQNTGFVPHMGTPKDISDVTQPPILGYGMRKLYEMDKDLGFIAELYPKNKRYLDWCQNNRDKDGAGLLEWFIHGNKLCRCGESGMDNSIRFDEAVLFDAPDFNAFYARDCGIMAEFAELLDLPEDAADWKRRQSTVNRLMNERLWDDQAGLYCDFNPQTRNFSPVLSSAGFLPLISGAPTQKMAERMLALLNEPAKFGTAAPVPSIACDNPDWGRDMWRGPMWTNINYQIAEGLAKYGFTAKSKEIFAKTQDIIEKYFRKYGTFFEFYDSKDQLPPLELDRKGPNNLHNVYQQPLRDYGWTATLYIDVCMTNADK